MWDLSQTSVTCRTVCGHLNEGHVTKGAFIWQPNTVRKPNRFTWYTNSSKRWHPEILWPQKRQNQEHQHKQGDPPTPHPPSPAVPLRVWIRQLSLRSEQSPHCSEKKDVFSTLFTALSFSLRLCGVLSDRPNKRHWKHPRLARPTTMSMVTPHREEKWRRSTCKWLLILVLLCENKK